MLQKLVARIAQGLGRTTQPSMPGEAITLAPRDDTWWNRQQADSIVFGNIEELNQERFKAIFSCGDKQRPLFLHLETVNICNLRCVICPYVSMQRPKETMPMELFDRIIDDYLAIGGGDVGLTPSVGDVFLDKMLVQRIRSLRTKPGVKSIGFVTNAGNAGVLSDDDLAYVINECTRINISVYGLDEEENAAMTRRLGKYDQILAQMKRIVSLNEKATIVFAFRLLKPDADARARSWMIENFGIVHHHDVLTQFSNWGGAIDTSEPLPLGGSWVNADEMETVSTGLPCAYPLLHLKVAVNGDVKFCSCIDYDSHPENIIGNVKEASLVDIYNGAKARKLWREGLSICKGCTHYKPVKVFSEHFNLLGDPIGSLGI
jgi:MoaA/NifB/PqqE/SkfB family radical SAM enzyme